MMASFYLALAICLAVTLNHNSHLIRSLGTAIAALSLGMMVSSIILADFDGTFAHRPPPSDLIGRFTPLILNIQAAIGIAAIICLLWAARAQLGRRIVAPLPLRNSPAAFGRISRYAHWTTAVLILALTPMGLFMSVLPANAPDRAGFTAAHQTMGILVLIIVVLRLAWLLRSPPPAWPDSLTPSERRLAHAVHLSLYGLILAFPLTGIFAMMCRGDIVEFFGHGIPVLCSPSQAWAVALTTLHDRVLPLLFYAIISAHLGAVIKHHVLDHRRADIRRMLQ